MTMVDEQRRARRRRGADRPAAPAEALRPRGEPGEGDPSDEDLAREALGGSREAAAALVHRYSTRIFRLFVRVLGRPDPAADLTQEVFLRMHRHLDRFDAEKSFRAWMYAIAWNLARDEIRRRQRHREPVAFESLAREGDDDCPEPADPKPAPPGQAIEERERDEWVQRALGRLPAAQRTLLVLREYEGLSYEELSSLLDLKIGTIKSQLHRARLELRDALLAVHRGWFEDYAGSTED
jgi:RNA polymerase sigma-70 factor (ECF subfamily)